MACYIPLVLRFSNDLLFIAIVASASAFACGDSKDLKSGADARPDVDSGPPSDAAPFVCQVEAPTSCPSPAPSYSDVKPIFDQRCVQCHNGETDEWPLTTFEHAASWFDLIPPEIANCRMPPPEAAVPITDEERLILLNWFRCGFPE